MQIDLQLSNSTIDVIDKLLINAIQNNYLVTFKVTDKQKKIRALAHFVCNGKHALYLKGINVDKSEKSGSMHLIMQYAIAFFSERAKIFDFGGGSNSNGLANFYKGLGGEMLEYGFLRVNKLPRLIKFIKNKK